jgi:probable phosphoglycerate mutase
LRATELLLLRHAESTWNAQGLWQGQGDPPLSDAGRRQAAACAARVRALAPELAITSDLQRALQTARIACGELELRIDARWREWDVGAWSGLPRDAIRARWPELYDAVRTGESYVTPPGGESRKDFVARVRAAAMDLAASHPGRLLLVVTHRGAIRALLPGSDPGHVEIRPFSLPAAVSSGEWKDGTQHPADPE